MRGVLLLPGALLAGCAWFGGEEEPQAEADRRPKPKTVVEVTGVSGDLAENVKLFVSLASENCDAARWRVERLLDRVDAEASDAVRAYGFYSPAVDRELDRINDCWRLRVNIDKGEPVLIEDVQFALSGEANDDRAFDGLKERLPVKPGAVLNHAVYESAKSRVASLAAQRGYFDGKFTRSEFRVDAQARSATVEFAYDSGPRYSFGKFEVDQDVLNPELIERMYDSPAGGFYDASQLTTLNSQFSDTGYFGDVIVRPDRDGAANREVPVTVRLEPLPQHSFSAGVGYATDVGPRVRVGYENRRVNRRGHRWSARAEGSALAQDVQAEYGIPLEDPKDEWFTARAGYKLENSDNVENRSARIGVRQTKKRPWNWLETRYIDLTDDDFEVGDQRGHATLLVPGISWSRTEVDDRLDPSRGWRANLDVRGAVEPVLSDASLFRVHLTADWLRRFSWGGRVLTRGEAGALVSSDFDQMPPSQRFFAGGDLSVRGYSYRELGPRDSSSDAIGGRYVLTGSFEYEHPIKGAFSGAMFVDAGNVSDEPSFPEGFGVGVGLGVRWRSPVGPVRLDVAHPLNMSDDVVQIHFRLGPDL